MKPVKEFINKLANDDGAEWLEYTLIAGLIIVAALAIFGTVGMKILGLWSPGHGAF